MITEKLQKKIDRSIRLLQSVQKRYGGEIEIAYSGGKDSDVILQLAKEAGIRYGMCSFRNVEQEEKRDRKGT